MRAIVATRFGGPEVLELQEVARPSPSPGEVLVRVLFASANPVDAKLRADGRWAGLNPPVILGYDAAGVIEEVGTGVTDLRVGEEVYFTPEIFGNPHGTYAEHTVVPALLVARKPKTLSLEEAAAVPLAGGTAWEAIVRRLAVRPGETVLILGGAGGVGSYAVQLAHAAGAAVLATASSAHERLLRELGVDVAIDYTRDDPVQVAMSETVGRGVDVLFSTVGGELVVRALRAVRPFGRVGFILGPVGDLSLAYVNNLTLHGIFLTRERARLEEMGRAIDQRRMRPVVTMVLPLEDTADVHRRLETGHGAGKIVLHVGRAIGSGQV